MSSAQTREFWRWFYEAGPKVKIALARDDPQTRRPTVAVTALRGSATSQCRVPNLRPDDRDSRIQKYFGGHMRHHLEALSASARDCNSGDLAHVHAEAAGCGGVLAPRRPRMQGATMRFGKPMTACSAPRGNWKDFDYRALAVYLGWTRTAFLTGHAVGGGRGRIHRRCWAKRTKKMRSASTHPRDLPSASALDNKLVRLFSVWEEMGQRFLVLREQQLRREEQKARQAAATPTRGRPAYPSTKNRSRSITAPPGLLPIDLFARDCPRAGPRPLGFKRIGGSKAPSITRPPGIIRDAHPQHGQQRRRAVDQIRIQPLPAAIPRAEPRRIRAYPGASPHPAAAKNPRTGLLRGSSHHRQALARHQQQVPGSHGRSARAPPVQLLRLVYRQW